MSYNPVPSEEIHARLEKGGFVRDTVGREVVYERSNHNLPELVVRVFTSAKVGSTAVADRGKDAIRLILLYRGATETVCVKKGPRVYRTGNTEDILGRMMERARELYGLANEIALEVHERGSCRKCGAPRYPRGGCVVHSCRKGE